MPENPEELFHAVAIALLTPIFIPITRDLERANLAAAAAIHRLGQSTGADIFTIAQLIAFNFAITNTLGLAMADDLDATLVVKLNNSATALFRCQDRAQRAIDARPHPKPVSKPVPKPPTPEEEAAIKAESEKQIRIAQNIKATVEEVAAIQKRHQAENPTTPMPATIPHPRDPSKRITTDPDKLHWVFSYAQIAEECVRDPDDFAYGCQKEANLRAKLLNSAAYDVLYGIKADLSPLTDFKTEAKRAASPR